MNFNISDFFFLIIHMFNLNQTRNCKLKKKNWTGLALPINREKKSKNKINEDE